MELQPGDMMEVVPDFDVWQLNLKLMPLNPNGHEQALKERRTINIKNSYLNILAHKYPDV